MKASSVTAFANVLGGIIKNMLWIELAQEEGSVEGFCYECDE
jgi:hypothetical protein